MDSCVGSLSGRSGYKVSPGAKRLKSILTPSTLPFRRSAGHAEQTTARLMMPQARQHRPVVASEVPPADPLLIRRSALRVSSRAPFRRSSRSGQPRRAPPFLRSPRCAWGQSRPALGHWVHTARFFAARPAQAGVRVDARPRSAAVGKPRPAAPGKRLPGPLTIQEAMPRRSMPPSCLRNAPADYGPHRLDSASRRCLRRCPATYATREGITVGTPAARLPDVLHHVHAGDDGGQHRARHKL